MLRLYLLWFNFGWQWIQFWVVIVHCDFSLSKESHVLQKIWSSFNHKVAHSCDHLVSKAKVSSKSHAVLVSLCLVYLHSDSATLLHCIQVTWSHCVAESNVTGPGCSALSLPSKGPISAQGYHRTKSLGKRARGGQGVKEGKNVEIWVANL